MLNEKLIEELEKYNQTHLIDTYNTLENTRKENFANQLDSLEFSLLDKLKVFKENNASACKGVIEPLQAMQLKDIDESRSEFRKIGLDAIKAGKVGAVLLAGGQGTRLGFDKPKGMFNIGINKQVFIFQRLIENLMDVVKEAGLFIPLMIMTSEKNNEDTVNFFKENNYFGYNKEYIMFFVQKMAPSVDFEGRLLLEDVGRLSLSPNGNGGWYSSLAACGVLDKVKKMGVEWLNVFAVDNVLQRIADPEFIGATIESGCVSGAKVVKKATPDERVGVMCNEDGRPSIVEYYELSDSMRDATDKNGEPAYNYGVILNYLFRISELDKIYNNEMPIHIVEKKIPYIDENGEYVNPTEPNGYKFEELILDMIHMLDSCLPYEVERSREFAPVKNKEGVDSIDTARELLIRNGIEI
ncbi:MAG: UDPGP type 1 family protein [Lachnospiraceae bacterium]|nr:UDPGP type 1 family protein [Lachnospiraceae bacterium]